MPTPTTVASGGSGSGAVTTRQRPARSRIGSQRRSTHGLLGQQVLTEHVLGLGDRVAERLEAAPVALEHAAHRGRRQPVVQPEVEQREPGRRAVLGLGDDEHGSTVAGADRDHQLLLARHQVLGAAQPRVVLGS